MLKRTTLVIVLGCLSLFLSLALKAQPPQFKMQSYINRFSKEAVHQMVEFKIPASVTLAQAIFESRSGTSSLSRKANNHFGIKCHMEWFGDTIAKDDDTLNECFRKYDRVEDSYTDHSLFLLSRPRYAELFKLPVTDYKSWCYGLKNAGYATYPTYAEELIRIIEQTQLYELDYSEKLNNSILVKTEQREIIRSKYSPAGLPMATFSRAGLLWADEKDMLIQSLDLVIEHLNEEDHERASGIADLKARQEIIPSLYTPMGFTVKTFSKTGLLWLDEKDVPIQNLDIIIERSGDDSGLADR